MRTRLGTAAAIVACAAVLVLSTAGVQGADGAERGKAPTRVSISSKFPAFHGRVDSNRARCKRGREVQVLRKRSGGRGPKRLGRDRSMGSGRWTVKVRNVKSGAYYAKAKPKMASGSLCKADRSRVVVVD